MPVETKSGFVLVADRRLHCCTAGDGSVSVFFEAGMGKSRSTWSLVQPLVAEFAHTIVYDRAGHGLSDPDETGRDFDRILDDHLAVLDATVDRPCVVVGHSYGGPVVRVAANRRPATIKAVALVDEVSEICKPERMMAAMRGASVLYGSQLILARLKLLRPLLGKSYYRFLQGAALQEAVDEGSTMKSVRAAWSEWRAFRESFTALHESGPHIPDVTLTTISSNRIPPEKDRDRDFLGAAHRRTAELSPSGRHVYSVKRNHYIPLVEPHLVAQEIRELVRQVGAPAGPGAQ